METTCRCAAECRLQQLLPEPVTKYLLHGDPTVLSDKHHNLDVIIVQEQDHGREEAASSGDLKAPLVPYAGAGACTHATATAGSI